GRVADTCDADTGQRTCDEHGRDDGNDRDPLAGPRPAGLARPGASLLVLSLACPRAGLLALPLDRRGAGLLALRLARPGASFLVLPLFGPKTGLPGFGLRGLARSDAGRRPRARFARAGTLLGVRAATTGVLVRRGAASLAGICGHTGPVHR